MKIRVRMRLKHVEQVTGVLAIPWVLRSENAKRLMLGKEQLAVLGYPVTAKQQELHVL